MQFHPIAEIFPLMSEQELNALAADIKETQVLREPIITHEGKIIDGRNRFKACAIAGVEPTYEEWDGKGSMVSYVVSRNLYRRHMSESQRAMVAAQIATMRQGERTDKIPEKHGESDNLPSIEGRLSQSETAEMMNVGVASVERASKVYKEGSKKLVDAVKHDSISVSAAVKVAELPKKQQDKVVKAIESGEAKTVKEAMASLPVLSNNRSPQSSIASSKDFEPDDDEPTIDDVIKSKNAEIESFCREVMKLVNEKCPNDEWLSDMNRRNGAIQKFKDGCELLRSCKCHCQCPLCQGDGCKDCRNTGRVPKSNYDRMV